MPIFARGKVIVANNGASGIHNEGDLVQIEHLESFGNGLDGVTLIGESAVLRVGTAVISDNKRDGVRQVNRAVHDARQIFSIGDELTDDEVYRALQAVYNASDSSKQSVLQAGPLFGFIERTTNLASAIITIVDCVQRNL